MNNNNEIDMLAIISVLLGIINVQENRQQSAHNDVQSANDKQAKYLIEELTKKFDKQNKILEYQNVLLERSIQMLEYIKNEND